MFLVIAIFNFINWCMKHWQLLNITTRINYIPPSADSGSAVSNTVPCYDLSVFPLSTSLCNQPCREAGFVVAELVLSPHSANEEPAQCRRHKSMWTRPLSPTESAGRRCVSSACLFSSCVSGGFNFKSHNNRTQSCFYLFIIFYFLIPAFWSAAEQKAWSQRNASFYFWKVVIKWSVFSCSWTCCTRKLCTRWSTGWECLHQSKSKMKRSCLPTCSRYLSIHPSIYPSFHPPIIKDTSLISLFPELN